MPANVHPLRSPGHPLGQPARPPSTPIDALVRIEAVRNGVVIERGTGFWTGFWPSAMITARHVVAGADSVRILAKGPGDVVELYGASVAYPAAPLDFAIVCTAGAPNVSNPYSLLVPGPEHDVAIEGYEPSAENARFDLVQLDGGASLMKPWMKLDHGGVAGMSGGPVVLRGTRHVVGVYVGPRDAGGHFAFATDDVLMGERMLRAAELRNSMMAVPT